MLQVSSAEVQALCGDPQAQVSSLLCLSQNPSTDFLHPVKIQVPLPPGVTGRVWSTPAFSYLFWATVMFEASWCDSVVNHIRRCRLQFLFWPLLPGCCAGEFKWVRDTMSLLLRTCVLQWRADSLLHLQQWWEAACHVYLFGLNVPPNLRAACSRSGACSVLTVCPMAPYTLVVASSLLAAKVSHWTVGPAS